MLKKAVQKGRSEGRPEEVHTAVRVGRSPLQGFWRTDKHLQALRPSGPALPKVEGLNDARTLHGKRRVLARRGWAGETSDFFSILLEVEWVWRQGHGLQR